MILCCGESLIDLLPAETPTGDTTFQPFLGGSIYNVAIGLGRLGCKVGYHGGISSDFFGDLLRSGLRSSQVDDAFVINSSQPTMLAFVSLKNGQPQYAFFDENSASRMIRGKDISTLPKSVTALHFGSLSLNHEPAASSWEALAFKANGHKFISIDVNIRPALVNDRATYIARLERMFAIAQVIKLSDEDFEWLYPESTIEDIAEIWLEQGAGMVVLTRGEYGAVGFSQNCTIEKTAETVKVSDTIGAGDSFMAGLLASLDAQTLLTPKGIQNIDQQQLARSLTFASNAAAITVSRAGANPPWASEINFNQE